MITNAFGQNRANTTASLSSSWLMKHGTYHVLLLLLLGTTLCTVIEVITNKIPIIRQVDAFTPLSRCSFVKPVGKSISIYRGQNNMMEERNLWYVPYRYKKELLSIHLKSSKTENNENKRNDYLNKYPTLHSFNEALHQIANDYTETRRVQFDVISRASTAEALLRTLENDKNAPYKPNLITYHYIVKIWSKTAHILAEGNGRGNLNDVLHALDDVNIPEELMDELNHICSARDAAEHAAAILSALETRYLTGHTDIQPDCRMYNIVMDGWNKSRARDNSEQIQKLFMKMKTLSEKGVTKSMSIDIPTNEGEKLVHVGAEVWDIVKPNAVTYTITIESYRQKTSESFIGDIDEFVADLERQYDINQNPNFKPDIGIANALIKSYMRAADYSSGGGGRHQKNMLSTSWKTAKKVHEVYSKWNKKFKTTNDYEFKPNVSTLTMVIDAYARCGDVSATETAQSIFDSMIEEWEKSGDDRMKPSAKTFTAMISAWSKTRDKRSPIKAEELIDLMEALYAADAKRGINSSLAPHSQAYTAAITAWARSLDNTKPQRALRLLKRVSDMYKETKDRRIEPNLYMYNAVIDACAKCHGSPEQQAKALQIAFAVNKAITASKHIHANHVTYATLLKAAHSLLIPGDEKNEIVKAVFEKCKKEGYVDFAVLKTLKLAVNQDMFYELMDETKDKNGYVDFNLCPHDWVRNVK